METTTALLKSYYGREKIVRTVVYGSMLLSGTTAGRTAKNWGKICSQLNSARTVMRLFDDPLMVAATKAYGWGTQEKDPITRILTLVGNAANQLYFPVEKVAWLADLEILPIKSGKWWTTGISIWAISLLTAILRSLRAIGRLRYKRDRLFQQRKLESPEKSSSIEMSPQGLSPQEKEERLNHCIKVVKSGADLLISPKDSSPQEPLTFNFNTSDRADKEFKESLGQLGHQEMLEYINIVKSSADLLNAVNWLPKGFLWAGKFSTAQSGGFGIVSSITGLLMILLSRK